MYSQYHFLLLESNIEWESYEYEIVMQKDKERGDEY